MSFSLSKLRTILDGYLDVSFRIIFLILATIGCLYFGQMIWKSETDWIIAHIILFWLSVTVVIFLSRKQ